MCNDLNALQKTKQLERNDCLFDLYNNLERSSKSCQYKIQQPKDFAIRLSDKEIFFLGVNNIVLTAKNDGDEESKRWLLER